MGKRSTEEKKKRKIRKRGKKKERDQKRKEKDLIWRWKGSIAKTQKGRRVATKLKGVGT